MRASAGSISWPARQAPAPIFLTTARSRFPVPHAGSKISPSMTGGIIEAMMAASSSEVTGAGRAGESAYRPWRSSNTSPAPCSAASAASDLQKRTWPGRRPSANAGPPGMRRSEAWAATASGNCSASSASGSFPVPPRCCGCRRRGSPTQGTTGTRRCRRASRQAATPRCKREVPATAGQPGRSQPACRWPTASLDLRKWNVGRAGVPPTGAGSQGTGGASSTPLPGRLPPYGRPARQSPPLACPGYLPSHAFLVPLGTGGPFRNS